MNNYYLNVVSFLFGLSYATTNVFGETPSIPPQISPFPENITYTLEFLNEPEEEAQLSQRAIERIHIIQRGTDHYAKVSYTSGRTREYWIKDGYSISPASETVYSIIKASSNYRPYPYYSSSFLGHEIVEDQNYQGISPTPEGENHHYFKSRFQTAQILNDPSARSEEKSSHVWLDTKTLKPSFWQHENTKIKIQYESARRAIPPLSDAAKTAWKRFNREQTLLNKMRMN
ncbi:MAG: hypothetical protein AAF558_06645 [Verrucomicrobiota bacterium]